MDEKDLEKILTLAIDGDYLKITLNNGQEDSGRYSPLKLSEVSLYTTKKDWRHYQASEISRLVRINIDVMGLPESIKETIIECEDRDYSDRDKLDSEDEED